MGVLAGLSAAVCMCLFLKTSRGFKPRTADSEVRWFEKVDYVVVMFWGKIYSILNTNISTTNI